MVQSITVGGLPGTGTTTACHTIAERTKLPYVYAGAIFREMAKEQKMTLEAFGAYCEQHPEVDRALDDRQVQILRGPPVLLEGRLSGFLAARERIPAHKVWLTCDPWVRSDRIVNREGGDREARMEEMRRREESEQKRYRSYYGFDLGDLSVYDAVIDTTRMTPEEAVREVLKGYERGSRRRGWWPFGRR